MMGQEMGDDVDHERKLEKPVSENQFRGRVALITGSTQGLGAGIAKRFAERGAQIALTGRSEDQGRQVLASLEQIGAEAAFFRADLADAASCAALVDAVLERFGRIDTLINSAADTRRSTLPTFTEELFDYQFALNVKAPLLLAQRAFPSLKEHGGVVINIGSVNAYMGDQELLIYSATKGALMTASRNLANALQRDASASTASMWAGWTRKGSEKSTPTWAGRRSIWTRSAPSGPLAGSFSPTTSRRSASIWPPTPLTPSAARSSTLSSTLSLRGGDLGSVGPPDDEDVEEIDEEAGLYDAGVAFKVASSEAGSSIWPKAQSRM